MNDFPVMKQNITYYYFHGLISYRIVGIQRNPQNYNLFSCSFEKNVFTLSLNSIQFGISIDLNHRY